MEEVLDAAAVVEEVVDPWVMEMAGGGSWVMVVAVEEPLEMEPEKR